MDALPPAAAWQHRDARSGFEVCYFQTSSGEYQLTGCTTAVEDGETWIVRYDITVAEDWSTRSAIIQQQSRTGCRERRLLADGAGHWTIDGAADPRLDGCRDVDLESSAMTNTLPIHRLDLPVGRRVQAPAAYVRALDLSVYRLEQQYRRLTDDRIFYTAAAFDFEGVLSYGSDGLVVDYPGIADRLPLAAPQEVSVIPL